MIWRASAAGQMDLFPQFLFVVVAAAAAAAFASLIAWCCSELQPEQRSSLAFVFGTPCTANHHPSLTLYEYDA